jgi:hypothetical protein
MVVKHACGGSSSFQTAELEADIEVAGSTGIPPRRFGVIQSTLGRSAVAQMVMIAACSPCSAAITFYRCTNCIVHQEVTPDGEIEQFIFGDGLDVVAQIVRGVASVIMGCQLLEKDFSPLSCE